LALGLLIACVVLSSACSQEETTVEPVVTVGAVPARRTSIERVVSAEAVLYPIDQAAITPKISAPVAKFYVQRGAHVKKGQLLATLENRDLTAAQTENKGAYDQAQAAYESTMGASLPEETQKSELDVKAAKASLDVQKKIYESRQDLFQQGAIPRRDLEQAEVSYLQAQNTFDTAQKHLEALKAVGAQQTKKSAAGQLESAKGKYLGSEAQLSYSEIRSPISGMVAERPLYAGEMAAAGTPLITVVNTSSVVARAHIPQEQATQLKVGDQAKIDAGGGLTAPGKVTVVSPALDPNSTTVEVWVEAPNPKGALRPGSSVQVSIHGSPVPDAIVIPANALIPTENGATAIMVVGSDGHAHRKEVKVGIRQSDEAQILSGLNAGETVVTEGAYGLPDNAQVKIANQTGPPAAGGDSGKAAASGGKSEE
jgi:multidrug efflux pump subunit AcrA (membrane-fusion protein)